MIQLTVAFLSSHKKCVISITVTRTIHYNTAASFMTHNLLSNKSFPIMRQLKNFLKLNNQQVERIYKSLACYFVSITKLITLLIDILNYICMSKENNI